MIVEAHYSWACWTKSSDGNELGLTIVDQFETLDAILENNMREECKLEIDIVYYLTHKTKSTSSV